MNLVQPRSLVGHVWVSLQNQKAQHAEYQQQKLARALAWHARGRRFDSDILHFIFYPKPLDFKGFCCLWGWGWWGWVKYIGSAEEVRPLQVKHITLLKSEPYKEEIRQIL